MPNFNTRFAVIIGTASTTTVGYPATTREYAISYMGAVHHARWTSHRFMNLKPGDHIIVDRRIPSTDLTILGVVFGDSTEGTPYDGTGGVIQPNDSPGGTAAGTPPIKTGGYLTCDIGPGFDVSHLHP